MLTKVAIRATEYPSSVIDVFEVLTRDDFFLSKVSGSEIPEEGDINNIRNRDEAQSNSNDDNSRTELSCMLQ